MEIPTTPVSKKSTGENFVVSSGHHLATLEAIKVLKTGGNIVDAAIAGAAVLSVVLPYACGLGGDVYALFRKASTGKVYGINGTGLSPSGATLGLLGPDIPRRGVRSITVPGMVRGWEDLLNRFGSRRLETLLQAAIEHAENGFDSHSAYIGNTRANINLLIENKNAAEIFLSDGKVPELGEKVRQPALAQTLRLIAENGADEFYVGQTAHTIAQKLQNLGGLISLDDLSNHESLWQEPISAPFYGFRVYTMPPNSWGITLPLQLIALENTNITDCDPSTPEFMVRGFLARQTAYNAVAGQVADPRIAEESAIETLNRELDNNLFGSEVVNQVPLESSGPDTSNIVVADKMGNAVSLIQSISTPYGSGIVAGDTGILLNNRMQGFTNDTTSANCVGPVKRPAHTLAPALVLKDGNFYMSLGTPGAPGQTCTMAQFLTRVLGHGENIFTAAKAPRWSVNFKGEPIVENLINNKFLDALHIKNQKFQSEKVGWITFGSIKAVIAEQGKLFGTSDGRRVADTLGN